MRQQHILIAGLLAWMLLSGALFMGGAYYSCTRGDGVIQDFTCVSPVSVGACEYQGQTYIMQDYVMNESVFPW